MSEARVPAELQGWFAGRGWRVRRHQAAMLAAADAGQDALLVADTGGGQDTGGIPADARRLLPLAARRQSAARGAAHALRLAAQGAGARRAEEPRHPGRGARAAAADRDAQRRYAVRAQAPPARPPAARAADDARIALADALLSGQLAALRRAEARGGGRGARLRHRQAGRPCSRSRWRGFRRSLRA